MDSDSKHDLLVGYLQIHILCQESQALGHQQSTRCMFYIKPKLTSSRFIASVFGTVPRSVQRTIKIASQWGKSEWCGHAIEIFIAKDSQHI